jgi:hypothetical protein
MSQTIDRNPPEFLVDEGEHLVESGLVAVTPVDEELGNTCGRWILH